MLLTYFKGNMLDWNVGHEFTSVPKLVTLHKSFACTGLLLAKSFSLSVL